MSKILSLLIGTEGGNWNKQRWRERFAKLLPDHDIVIAEGAPDPHTTYACTWKPPRGALSHLPHLEVIFNLGAGVDALLTDPSLPDKPIVRAINDNLTMRMSEYVLLHTLIYHRQVALHRAAQARAEWITPEQWGAQSLRVGVMGTGILGLDALKKLKLIGFDVAGWGRSRKEIADIPLYAGNEQLTAFLNRTDLLIVLLPATPDTNGLLNRALFERLAKDGPLGGPVLINAGRGSLQNEADLLACLQDGTLKAATLDVFAVEPLPPHSPFWALPNVTITPHNAADSDPDAIAGAIAAQIKAYERGEALSNVVCRDAGY